MNEKNQVVNFQIMETIDVSDKDDDEPMSIAALRQGAVGTITVEKNGEILYRWIRDDPYGSQESGKE